MNLPVKALYLAAAFILGAFSAQTVRFLHTAPDGERRHPSENVRAPEGINLEAPRSAIHPPQSGKALRSPHPKLASLAPEAYRHAQSQLEPQRAFLMVQELSATNPRSAIAILDTVPPEQKPRLALAIAQNWSLQDPAAALAWLRERQGSLPTQTIKAGFQSVLSNYAKVAPRAAFAQMDTLSSPVRRAILLAEIGDALARKNPEGAVNWLASLDVRDYAPEAINGAYANVMTRYLESKPHEAARTITQLDSSSLQRQLAPQMAVQLAHTDMAGALSWVDALDDLPAKQASLAAIAEHNLQDSPEAAMIALLSFPELLAGESNPLHETLQSLAPKAPQTLEKEFNKLPQSARPKAALALTQTWIEKPSTLPNYQSWLERLEPGEQGDPSFRLLAQHYAVENPAAALRWADRLQDKRLRLDTLRETVYESPNALLPDLAETIQTLKLDENELSDLTQLLDERLETVYAKIKLP